MAMEIIRTLFLLLSTLLVLLPCGISAHNIGKTQQEALSHILEEKMMMVKNNDDAAKSDRSHFNANHHHLRIDAKATTYPQDGMKEKDRIEKLPGQPSHVKFDQYGGYITVNQTTGKAFYYYFVEAPRSDKPLPLLLWLNGGPGCSSLAYGAMQELGPFRVHSDGKTLYRNKYAWNYAANVLFLESPAGVGFSYSNTTSDYTIGGDKQTAKDNLIFLLNWFERFPEYKGRDFYISGESYAGHYVPQLAHLILYNNKNNAHHYINFKGILIGNALINDETDAKGMYAYFAGHALISDVTKDQIFNYCDFSPNATKQSPRCKEAAVKVNQDLSDIYIFNIYAPWCTNTNLTDSPKKITGESIDPCSDYYGIAYLNRADVQEAIHANVTKISYDWQPCSDVLTKWEDSPDTIIPLLQELMENGLRVWIFSGDLDGRIPFTSTIKSINVMNLPIKSFWHPWFFAGEVGGYTQVYEGNLTFATVRGAGHQVPSYQPERALSLVMHFLSGTELPADDSS